MNDAASASSRLARFFGAVPKVFWCVFLVYIVVCIVLDVAVAPFVSYRFKWGISSLGFALLPLGIVLGLLACWLARKMPLPKARSAILDRHGFALLVWGGGLILFAIQLFLARGAYFLGNDVDWDMMLQFDDPQLLSAYYSIYPNNHFLGGIFAVVYRIGHSWGMDPYHLLLGLNCLIVTVSICLSAFSARKIGGTKCGLCAYALMFVFIGFNPFFMVPYTDSYGILFTSVILFIYTCFSHPAKWPVMAFVSVLGYHMKPTILSIFGAAVLVSACLWLKSRLTARPGLREQDEQRSGDPGTERSAASKASGLIARAQLMRFAGCVAASAVAAVFATGIVSATEDQVGVPTYPDEAVVPAHYLMMGFNPRYDGMFNAEDRDLSWQYHSREEMAEADLAEWRARVKDLGPSGILQLMMRKNLVVYNSGDFLFHRTDDVLINEVKGTDPLIQGFYGIAAPEDEGAETVTADDPDLPVPPWAWIAQVLWFMILTGVACCFFRKRPAAPELAMAIALLLLSGFLLLFECSARYLYLYAPFYVILAVRGWQAFGQGAARRLASKR